MYNELKKYSRETISFHMPGHKAGGIEVVKDGYQVDVTEVPGTDDLHHPTGMIKAVQNKIANIYQAEQSYMLVNGSTAGILATMAERGHQQGSILVARNCHKAVYHSLYLHSIEAYYVYPTYDEKNGFYGEVRGKDIEKLLKEHGDIHTVVITSPTYEGIVSDIKAIREITHAYGAKLVVDEAHGAHFVFSSYLPMSAIQLGADYVVQSTHKTLPCFTQTAILHTQKLEVDERQWLEEYLRMYQTSSPSYLLMSSIEKGIDYMVEHQQIFSQWICNLERKKKEQPIEGGYWFGDDPTRLTFVLDKKNVSGHWLSERLRQQHHIQVEMSGERHIVAIATLGNSDEELQALFTSIQTCLDDVSEEVEEKTCYSLAVCPQKKMSIGQAKRHEKKQYILLEEAIGRVSATMIIPYPPGIPLVLPGEVILDTVVEYIHFLQKQNKEIYGIIKDTAKKKNNWIQVVVVEEEVCEEN